MLCELAIKNFAIIDDIRIRLADGLTVLSGETGAGKSIIINAVNLLLGSRANATLIRTGAEAAELEAFFEVDPGSRVAALLTENGFDPAEGLIIRRVISGKERHRVYINGRLATMQLLNDLTENLASISGQHAHQGLLKEEQQLLILDQFGQLLPLRRAVAHCYQEIIPLIAKLADYKALQSRRSQERELLAFQQKEIQAAGLEPDEDLLLENEKNRLKNAELLYRTVYESVDILYSREGAVVEALVDVKKGLENAARIDPQLSTFLQSLSDAAFHLQDIAESLQAYMQTLQFDEGRLEEIGLRLDALNKLKRKYGGSLTAVFAHLAKIEKELADTENLSDRIAQTEKEIFTRHAELSERARTLSQKRAETAKNLAAKVEQSLAGLKMGHTRFEVALSALPAGNADPHLAVDEKAVTAAGIDQAAFLIAPNVGEALKPLSQIASGGELSRVVLALKTILAQIASVETIVFDEVDAGIGGGVAEVVGKKLHELAQYNQVLCITHLPQIAKFADHHFKVVKGIIKGRTQTRIETLNAKGRIDEIARMLGGEEITPTTLKHARELLKTATQ